MLLLKGINCHNYFINFKFSSVLYLIDLGGRILRWLHQNWSRKPAKRQIQNGGPREICLIYARRFQRIFQN